MVCDQNGKKSGEFAVCLALRFGPKNVEFGGISQALGRDGLIPNRPLGLVIKGSSGGTQAISNQFELMRPPRALFRFPSAQSEVWSKAAFAASVCLQRHGRRDVQPASLIWDGDL